MVGKDDGPGSSPAAMLSRRAICVAAGAPFLLVKAQSAPYWPEPDAGAGWRRPGSPGQCRREAGLDPERLAEAFEYIRSSSKNGGLLVARRGWLALEGYFGRGHAEATPNAASVGKSFTSLAMGILLGEQASRFPEGLNQRVMTRDYFPAAMFPLSDPRKSEIRLGQLLAMTAGIRGNNPGYVFGEQQTLQPEGPDGWEACRDDMAFGRAPGGRREDSHHRPFGILTLPLPAIWGADWFALWRVWSWKSSFGAGWLRPWDGDAGGGDIETGLCATRREAAGSRCGPGICCARVTCCYGAGGGRERR